MFRIYTRRRVHVFVCVCACDMFVYVGDRVYVYICVSVYVHTWVVCVRVCVCLRVWSRVRVWSSVTYVCAHVSVCVWSSCVRACVRSKGAPTSLRAIPKWGQTGRVPDHGPGLRECRTIPSYTFLVAWWLNLNSPVHVGEKGLLSLGVIG